MYVMCQNCHRLYDVPSNLIISERQNFKCQACGFVFHISLAHNSPVADEREDAVSVNETIAPILSVENPQPIIKTDVLDDSVRQETFTEDFVENRPDFSTIFEPMVSESLNDNPLEEPILEKNDVFAVQEEKKSTLPFGKWLVLLTVAFAIILLGYESRYYLSRKVPALRDFYEFLGISTQVLGENLELKDVTFNVTSSGVVQQLNISGMVVNPTENEIKVPLILVSVYDDDFQELHRQFVSHMDNGLPAGGQMPFSTQIKKVSLKAKKINVTFSEGE